MLLKEEGRRKKEEGRRKNVKLLGYWETRFLKETGFLGVIIFLVEAS